MRLLIVGMSLVSLLTSTPGFSAGQGRQMLPFLEGRWSDSTCDKYVEISFARSDRSQYTLKYPSGASKNGQVNFDNEDNIVMFNPSTNYTSIIKFKTRDLMKSTDIDKGGKVTSSDYRRCK